METKAWLMITPVRLLRLLACFVFCIGIFFALPVDASGDKKIGEACHSNSDCESDKCGDGICMCDDINKNISTHCADTYGGSQSWRCMDSSKDPVPDDTAKANHRGEWNFCVRSDYTGTYPTASTDAIKYPVERKAYMGEACDDNDFCLSTSCDDTAIDSTQQNDPWYQSNRKLRVCRCWVSASYAGVLTNLICTNQYGHEGQWKESCGTVASGQGSDIQGLDVCEKKDGWMPTTLTEMKKNIGPTQGSGSDGSSISMFGINATIADMPIIKPTPRISIPGVSFSDVNKENSIVTDEMGASWLVIPFLGEYIAAIYRYSVVLITFIAMVSLILAGVQWIVSGGSSDTITKAKKRIITSLIAIVLTAGSYTILFAINPELVNFRNLRILVVKGEPLEEFISNDLATHNLPTDSQGNVLHTSANTQGMTATSIQGTVTKKPASINEITSAQFKKDKINGVSADGWAIWDKLSEQQKNTVLPHLFINIAECGAAQNFIRINIDHCTWKNKMVHRDVVSAVQRAVDTATKYGFQLCPSTTYRSIDEETKLWNTGVVARFQTGVQRYYDNEGKIALPSCIAPHSSGGAADLFLSTNNGKTRLTTPSRYFMNNITQATNHYNNPSKEFVHDLILQEIMHEAGWVRYCQEAWHFEYGITQRFSNWVNKDARCLMKWAHWDIPITAEQKQRANSYTAQPIFP